MSDIVWLMIRDERGLAAIAKVRECMKLYALRMQVKADVVGVTSSFPVADEQALVAEEIKVVRNLPAWAKDEVWVGSSDEKAQIGEQNASL